MNMTTAGRHVVFLRMAEEPSLGGSYGIQLIWRDLAQSENVLVNVPLQPPQLWDWMGAFEPDLSTNGQRVAFSMRGPISLPA